MSRLIAAITWILWIAVLGVAPHAVHARVTGPCSDCHTMHYSQGGAALSDWGAAGPYEALVTNDCIGCHTAPLGEYNDGNTPPYVNSIQDPDYRDTGTESGANTLAGGNFYWMSTDSTTGHDVEGIATGFDRMPPGHNPSQSGTRGPWPANQNVTCAGAFGCHGRASETNPYESMRGGHHGDDAVTDGSTLAASYRLLDGVAGIEDPQWEFQPTATAHNQYKGVHRAFGDGSASDTTTISYLCFQCHGDFHSGSGNVGGGSPWLRHPTDVQLPNYGEYVDYNTDNTYSVVAPVGSADVSSVLSSVNPGTGDCVVTCLSCHRAHGSPYFKLMRWDYKSWPADGVNGCAVCHTWKD